MHDPVTELGRRLLDSGYDEDGLEAALGGIELERVRRMGTAGPVFVDEPLATLAELFFVVRPVERDTVATALGQVPVDALVDEGLISPSGDAVVAQFQISPWLGELFAHDPLRAGALPADYVAGGNASAATLAGSTIRIPAQRALDLGCGSGVQTLLAARHCGHVVAVDINPRAVELTRLNARLNGRENVEVRQGDWFEPVAGELFDLIVSNPPYVLSPDADYLFRDGDRSDDADLHAVSRRLVQGVSRHLAPGGIGHVLCEWGLRAGEDRYGPVSEWTAELGCDVCVVSFGAEQPGRHAARWNDIVGVDPARYAQNTARWIDCFAQHGLETIQFGVVVLRRGFGPEPWFHAVDAPGTLEGDGGRQLLRIVEAQDYLHGSDLLAPELEDERFEPVDGHAIVERNTFHDGRYTPDKPALTLEDSLGIPVTIEPVTLEILLALDGRRSLGEVCAGLADRLDLDPEEFAEFAVATVRQLLELGLVVRV